MVSLFKKFSSGGRSSIPPPPPPVKAPKANASNTNDLHTNISNLDKKIAQLETQVEREKGLAKQQLQLKNRQRAMVHLKNRKRYEIQITRLQGQRSNMEQLQDGIASAAMMKETFNAHKEAARVLRATKVDIKEIEAVKDEQDELLQELDEAQEAMSRPVWENPEIALGAEEDLEALEAEIREERSEQGREILSSALNGGKVKTRKPAPAIPKLPEVPRGEVMFDDDDDADLAALSLEMS